MIELCASIIYYKFPKRLALPLSIGDACSITGCPQHPPGSHGPNLNKIDFNYYTIGKTNHTQFRPDGESITRIWAAGKRGVELFTEVFDWERNYILWWMLWKMMPESRFSTQILIQEYMATRISEKYGINAHRDFLMFTVGDPGTRYNHDIHVHVDFGRNFNWELDIKQLWYY